MVDSHAMAAKHGVRVQYIQGVLEMYTDSQSSQDVTDVEIEDFLDEYFECVEKPRHAARRTFIDNSIKTLLKMFPEIKDTDDATAYIPIIQAMSEHISVSVSHQIAHALIALVSPIRVA